ncbi:polymorphic toxin-type HINT domain-containing protein [Nocardiopsis sp. LOL_012]|uniref:polymorphic toxin-type HINT domain-containing protein n=1 Tax=Nocardiopsis sp. LOL_012 TaxID=3345409 RepID=UPI003A87B3D5
MVDPTTEREAPEGEAPEGEESEAGGEHAGVPGPVAVGDTVIATDEHPFWVPELEEWVDAIDLAPGMWLQTSAGTWVQVSAVGVWTQPATVHNLTVQGVHTFHVTVGETDTLTHNCSDPLRGYADEVRNLPGNKFASEYTSPSGQVYYGRNRHGESASGALEETSNRTGHHNGCAEVHCLIQAQRSEGESAISGGSMRTLQTRNGQSSRAAEHGNVGQSCGRCRTLLGELNISY